MVNSKTDVAKTYLIEADERIIGGIENHPYFTTQRSPGKRKPRFAPATFAVPPAF